MAHAITAVRYASHYNGYRTHLGLNKDTPLDRSIQSVGRIVTERKLGGRHCQRNVGRRQKMVTCGTSSRELTPFGQCGGTVLLEDVTVGQVAFKIEVVVN